MKKKASLSMSNIIKSGFSPGSSGREAAIKHKKSLLLSSSAAMISTGALTGAPMGALGALMGGITGKILTESIGRRIKLREKRKRVKAKTNIQIKRHSDQIHGK